MKSSGGIVEPSREGTNSTSQSGRDSHWWPTVGKSSPPISTLRLPLRGRQEAIVVSATDTDGASATEPGGACSSSASRVRSRSSRGSQSLNQDGVPSSFQTRAYSCSAAMPRRGRGPSEQALK